MTFTIHTLRDVSDAERCRRDSMISCQGRGPVNVNCILRFSHGISESRMEKDLKELMEIYYPPMVGFTLQILLNYQYYNFSGSQNVIPYSYI